MKNKISIFRNIVTLALLVCVLSSNIPKVSAASKVNWKSLYQSKVQQIENEYKQEKRTKDEVYNIAYFSLQDIDFDGIPELYHALIRKDTNGYAAQDGTEEIYYIKNNRVVLGKIESHDTLGLLPALSPQNTLNDRNWQFAFYNIIADSPAFIAKNSWSDKSSSGTVIISELTFDSQKGVLRAKELIKGEYNKGAEPTYVDGHELICSASSYSASKTLNDDMWNWTPPYVIAEKKSETKPSTTTKTWKDYYKDFILNKQYTKASQKYYTNNTDGIIFALHDFNKDGIPEIVVKNGATAEKDMSNYVYTFKNNKVTYLGKAGTLSSDFKLTSNPVYPGLYWESGSNGEYKGYYYNISNDKIAEEYVLIKKVEYSGGNIEYSSEQKTTDKTLYETCKNSKEKLSMYTVEEIKQMGWDSFINGALQSVSGIYIDVPLNSWYNDAVQYMNERGIMGGVSATRFDPDSQITRAMFVTVLYRLEKEPSTSRVSFKDVPKGSWYENAISWASRKGIANGVTDDMFAPDDKITREQLTTILYRYAKYKNKSVMTDEYNIKSFIDNNIVSEYAVEPMNWAVGNELISGTSKLYLDPFGMATRAQAAVILQRFCEKYKL